MGVIFPTLVKIIVIKVVVIVIIIVMAKVISMWCLGVLLLLEIFRRQYL